MYRIESLQKLSKVFLSVVIIALPILLCMFFSGERDLTNFVPIPTFGDETGYYRVTKSWVDYAENFGNYGVTYGDDVAAKAGGFSAHGPKYIVLYGIIARLFGWETYSILFFNILLLTLAIAVFIYLSKMDNGQMVCFAVLIGSFFPMLFFLVSGMVETLHFAFILVFMGLFYRFFETRQFKWYLPTYLFISFMVFFRINYFVLFIPLVVLYRNRNIKLLIIDLVLSLLISIFSYILIGYFSSPYPSYLDGIISGLKSFDIFGVVMIVMTHAKEQLVSYFGGSVMSNFEELFKYCYLFCFATLTVIGIIIVKRERSFNLILFSAIIMFAEFLIVVFLYEFQIFKGFRTLAVFLFIPFVCVILQSKKLARVFVIILAVINLMISSGYKTYRNDAIAKCSIDLVVTKTTEIDELFEYIPYDESGDRWKNTIALPNRMTYDYNVMFGFPGYVGMNYLLTDDFSMIDKCEYILADNENVEDSVNGDLYEKVYESYFGILYKRKT